jgi:hypothetical protein
MGTSGRVRQARWCEPNAVPELLGRLSLAVTICLHMLSSLGRGTATDASFVDSQRESRLKPPAPFRLGMRLQREAGCRADPALVALAENMLPSITCRIDASLCSY